MVAVEAGRVRNTEGIVGRGREGERERERRIEN
jgi:hypothetical protein